MFHQHQPGREPLAVITDAQDLIIAAELVNLDVDLRAGAGSVADLAAPESAHRTAHSFAGILDHRAVPPVILRCFRINFVSKALKDKYWRRAETTALVCMLIGSVTVTCFTGSSDFGRGIYK